MSILTAKALHKAGRLQPTDLSIEAEERVALIGANGAGKSTLLRLASGLLLPTSGTVLLFGQPASVPAARAKVGLLLDHTSLPGRMTPTELWAQCGHAHPPALFERLGVNAPHKPIAELSTGQRQRVGLALAFATSPKLLLLDEPLSGLDDDGIAVVETLLADSGAAMLVATHRRDTLKSLWTRTLTLVDGVLQ